MGKKQKINNKKSTPSKSKKVKKVEPGNEAFDPDPENELQFEDLREEVRANQPNIKHIAFGENKLFALKIGQFYKIKNGETTDLSSVVLNGRVNANGKNFEDEFCVKAMNTLLIYIEERRKIKIEEKIEKVLNQMDYQTAINWVKDHYENQQEILIYISGGNVQIQPSQSIWGKLKAEDYCRGSQTMLMGLKNSGKSYFCEYLLNYVKEKKGNLCLIDSDLGKNRLLSGCVSLTIVTDGEEENQNLWIGETTPLNNINGYIQALKYFHRLYKEKYFTHSLIINTMGYLTGIGEILFYEIFDIIKPTKILVMNGDQLCSKIQNIIKHGEYLKRTHFTSSFSLQKVQKTSTNFFHHENVHSQAKPSSLRFQPILTKNSVKNIEDLLMLIYNGKLKKIAKQIKTFQQNKEGKVSSLIDMDNIEMRLVVLGRINIEGLIEVFGLGFGWNGNIFFDQSMINQSLIEVGLVSDGIDFEKLFYQINEKNLVCLQEYLGRQIPFITLQIKVLGSKGIRNNVAKAAQKMQ